VTLSGKRNEGKMTNGEEEEIDEKKEETIKKKGEGKRDLLRRARSDRKVTPN